MKDSHRAAIQRGIAKKRKQRTTHFSACAECHDVTTIETYGRPRRFCSDACRQKSYRNRKETQR
jgi:cytochrome c553